VRPAERIGEIKVLQVAGLGGLGANGGGGNGDGAHVLGTTLGPVAKTILEASAVMPLAKELLAFADLEKVRSAVAKVLPDAPAPAASLTPGTPATPPRSTTKSV